jgi:phospholipase/carboxylesterase
MPVLDDLPHVLRPAAGEAAGAIVLLHGPGTGEQDPAALLEILDPAKRLVAACPRGTITIPSAVGSQWFIDREVGYPNAPTFEGSFTILCQWLDMLVEKTGVPLERTIVGGFSQGATMAWALVLGKGRPRMGGLVALSGYIPRVADLELEPSNLTGLPVAICHGENDDVVPVAMARTARDRAMEAGAEVFYRETDVPHIIDLRVIPDLAGWIGRRFA